MMNVLLMPALKRRVQLGFVDGAVSEKLLKRLMDWSRRSTVVQTRGRMLESESEERATGVPPNHPNAV